MTDFIPNPLNYTPRYTPPKQQAIIDDNVITDDVLAQLDAMSSDDIKTLIKRICGARWGQIALMSEDEAYDAVCLKFLHGGLTQTEIWKALPPLKEWADRRRGKPAQSIAMTVEDKGLDRVATDKLLRLAAMLDDPVIIAPMPKKLLE